MIKKILKTIIPPPLSTTFHIGFVQENNIQHNTVEWYDSVHWIDTTTFDKDGNLADPFFYSIDDENITLLAEQMYRPLGHGRLVKMTVRRKDNVLIKVDPILELDTHLSFPIIWKENGKVYIYPENNQSGALKIWEFDGNKLCNPVTLVDEPLIDSQMVKIGEEYFIMGVNLITGAWSDTQDLQIYKSDSLFGPYTHIQTIHNVVNEQRGGGEIIKLSDTEFLRPAQRCVERYGSEIVMYKMEYVNGMFSERELYRIRPNEKRKNGLLLHTYNEMNGLVVIDGLSWNHPMLSRISKILRPNI